MTNPLRPTLVRRVTIAVVIAFMLVWVALTAYEFTRDADETRIRRNMDGFVQYELTAIEDVETAPEVFQFVYSLEREFNSSRRGDGRPDALMELSDPKGRRVFGMTYRPLPGRLNEVVPMSLDGRRYLVFRGDKELWTFQIAYPMTSFGDTVRRFGGPLGLRLIIAFPVILIPVWLAVSRGLFPLRRLSGLIAARHADDLAPIGFDGKYGEVKPLISAIDRLMAQLRQKMARERAFVQDAAHELRTPIAVISAHVHVLARATTASEKQEAERHLDHAVARASHLIEQLLDLARTDSTAVPERRMLDVAQLTRQSIAQSVPAAQARQIQLSCNAPDSLNHPLEKQTFLSILQNLLDNAIRYVHPGGNVVVNLKQDAGTLTLAVIDDGPGIAAEDRSRVFERFFRGPAEDVAGSGLGLAIVRQAASRLGGSTLLSTGPNERGCEFVVVIPAVAVTITGPESS